MKILYETARRAALIASGCALVTLCGCAEVTFKRGAGPGEMQATEQGCRDKTADVEAYKACLHAAGFIYAKPSGATALFVEQNEEQSATNEVAPSTVETEVPAAIPAATSDAAPTVKVEPSGRAGQALPQAAKPKSKLAADPLKQVTVASWWKLGGTAGGLEADQGTCATTLGNAHRVAPNAKLVTVGMLRCLKGKGCGGALSKLSAPALHRQFCRCEFIGTLKGK